MIDSVSDTNVRDPGSDTHGTVERAKVGVRTVRRRLVGLGRAVAFWSAIALPFVYVPLLLTGVESTTESLVVLRLVALNAVFVVAGHSHRHQ